jgi:hypothetical protein
LRSGGSFLNAHHLQNHSQIPLGTHQINFAAATKDSFSVVAAAGQGWLNKNEGLMKEVKMGGQA